MDNSRRNALKALLFGPGLVGLRSLCSGIPVALLLAADAVRPDRVAAASTPPELAGGGRTPQFVLFAASGAGDPINCNVPGCYDDATIVHGSDPSMAATTMALGSTTVRGAQVWSTMPAAMRAQACFFHHATYTVVHPDIGKVLRVQGATRGGEMLPSVLSQALAQPLGTLRDAPINFNGNGNGAITSRGILQPTLTPRTLASLLSVPGGGLGDANLVALRDKTVDGLNSWLKKSGPAFQGNVLDAYVISRGQTRALQDSVVRGLEAIGGDDVVSTLRAAVMLFQLKVAPAVMVNFGFGADNHTDYALQGETQAHKSSLAAIGQLPALCSAAGLVDRVTLCSLNVFGRTLNTHDGRNHNDGHAVSLIVGANVRAGVVGGVAAAGSARPYVARNVDSATGAASDGGDVTFSNSLASYAKTLCAASGMTNEAADFALRSGTIVRGALVA